ncbi:MAG: DNA-methyltransferase [Candidatus Kariarchaeaceae archaeon]
MHSIIHGDVWAGLTDLTDYTLDCAITSPPYFSQRDYGFPGQIGNEVKLEEYLAKLVSIFALLRKKLKPNGVFYLNIGDKYLTKYGNTPLGMIPYQLAYYLVLDGWRLEDVIIWYKPNHMPSSVKNRFTNTYEPIFVLAKNETNYYNEYKKSVPSSSIAKIPVQPLEFKHVASYPEKLVEKLLTYGLPKNAFILDPFAGSGTTAKAAQNLNSSTIHQFNFKTVLIEAHKEYIDIIAKRCNLSSRQVQTVEFMHHPINPLPRLVVNEYLDNYSLESFGIKPSRIIIRILKSRDQFKAFFHLLLSNKLEFLISTLSKGGWIVRNMIIIPQDNSWFPIFFLVKDIKSVKYQFNLDNIRINHLSNLEKNYGALDFISYRVVQTSAFYKDPKEGVIAKVVERYSNGLPHWVVVKWENTVTCEEVINGEAKDTHAFYCPRCNSKLRQYHHYRNDISCGDCSLILWQDIDSIPLLKMNEPDERYQYLDNEFNFLPEKLNRKSYTGKFKDEKRINLGQSPGARSSVSEIYFSFVRYYKVKQSLVSDYINLYRKKLGLSKKQLTELFPPEYKHTVGHWIRKDMGGSLPKREDLMKLQAILDLDANYVSYINRMGLKIQMVLPDTRGKNPGDYWECPISELIDELNKL